MTPVYLDSSALIKRYVRERGSDGVERLFREDSPLLVSSVAWAECLAALARKLQEGSLSRRLHERARGAFTTEWASLHEVRLTAAVQARVLALVDEFHLRGMDAIHLASATWARDELRTPLQFVCADRRLAEIAHRAGLPVLDPEREA